MEIYERYIGQVFDDRYRIEKIIGTGGMAIVFQAVDLLMNRYVAVKVLKDEVARDEASVQRFINESKAVAMLSHTNIVSIYDVSVTEKLKYIVMEYIDGITLKNYMNRRGQLPFKEILGYAEQILRALAHAHSKGIIHRDIKPQNIMLLKNGQIKVMDFGIAKLPNAETVTMTDKAIGTVFYISPEQASGRLIDSRSDLYSLGIMMYEMAGGRLPFNADNPVTVAMMQINETAQPLSTLNAKVPKGLEQIIAMAMEKEPANRYQNAEQMLRQVRKLRENPRLVFVPVKTAPKKEKKKKERAEQPAGRDSRSMFPIILGVVSSFFIIAAACGVILLSQLFSGDVGAEYEEIEVPNFIDAKYSDDLAKWFENSDIYDLVEIKYTYDETVEAGCIIAQEPRAGSVRKVKAGAQKCELTLTVSTGAETVTVPDYTVQNHREAQSAIRHEGLRCTVEWEPSDTYEYGYVMRMSPAPGEVVNINTLVTLYVSSGPAGSSIKVGSFLNMTEAEALYTLQTLGLAVGSVSYEPSDTVPKGQIISQLPAPSASVVRNTKVNFVVSMGPSGVKMPNLVGMEQAVAETVLKNLELFNVSVVPQQSSTVEAGLVIRTEPAATEVCESDTPIVLYVSMGVAIQIEDYADRYYTIVENRLRSDGLICEVIREYSDEYLEGFVIRTEPGAGQYVQIGSKVIIVVSMGKVPDVTTEPPAITDPPIVDPPVTDPPGLVSVPNLRGWTLEAAKAELDRLGLLYYVSYSTHKDFAAGYVFGQNITPFTEVTPGTLIMLHVSVGTS